MGEDFVILPTMSRTLGAFKTELEGSQLHSGEKLTAETGLRYIVGTFLGRGAIAEVWCARKEDSPLLRAIKILNRDTEEEVCRFHAEIRALAQLSHPGIVTIEAQGIHQGHPWFAMELLDPLPETPTEAQVRRWILQLCDATEELHRHGMLHRDIKRSNVMLRGSHAVLTDFGLIKPLEARTAQSLMTLPHPTLVGELHGVGTPGRSAPEQFEGAQLSAAADVFALGMLARDLLPDWQRYPVWRRVMKKALNADPSLRCQTPEALARHLSNTARWPWLKGAVQWCLPWLVVGAIFGYQPLMDWHRTHAWDFARAGFYVKEQAELKPYTVYASVMLREAVTELALPENPHGVVWIGGLAFERSDCYQRLILWSPSPERKIVIGNIYSGASEHEIVLVGDVDFHCTDIYGYVPFPTPTDGHLLGKAFSEDWVDHVRPVAPTPPVKIRRVATLAEARALPPIPLPQ